MCNEEHIPVTPRGAGTGLTGERFRTWEG
ncbi:hypothetical protein KRR40_08390 [Niabella defluvii]|nr:hypothetical protein KRR40_08390 [Niabella sp. I65]